MSEPRDLPRVYGEKEIGRLLKRATELQHAEPTSPSAGGLTLAELEEIAAEAGIDPRHLRRAARELDVGGGGRTFWTHVVGDELMLVREASVPGEIGEGCFERLVATIQMGTREHGHPSLLGRTLSWRAETPSKTRTVQVLVTARDGHTRVRIEENLSQFASGLFGGGVAGAGIGVGVGLGMPAAAWLGSTAFAVAAPLATVALCYLGARELYRGTMRRRTRAADDLLSALVREIEACLETPTPP